MQTDLEELASRQRSKVAKKPNNQIQRIAAGKVRSLAPRSPHLLLNHPSCPALRQLPLPAIDGHGRYLAGVAANLGSTPSWKRAHHCWLNATTTNCAPYFEGFYNSNEPPHFTCWSTAFGTERNVPR